MPKTSNDLAKRVGVELRILAAGEDLEAHDNEQIIADYNAILEELETRGIAAWDAEAIPDKAFLPLVQYIASRIGYAYGREYPYPPEAAFGALARVMAVPYNGQVAEIEHI